MCDCCPALLIPPPGTIELKEMVEIIGTLYEMEGVNSDTAGQNLVGLAL